MIHTSQLKSLESDRQFYRLQKALERRIARRFEVLQLFFQLSEKLDQIENRRSVIFSKYKDLDNSDLTIKDFIKVQIIGRDTTIIGDLLMEYSDNVASLFQRIEAAFQGEIKQFDPTNLRPFIEGLAEITTNNDYLNKIKFVINYEKDDVIGYANLHNDWERECKNEHDAFLRQWLSDDEEGHEEEEKGNETPR